MALKPFEQVYPGQNDPNRQPKKGKQIDPAEWERKQRLKEYRIAARREKRNRKSDEKKQRKLNATILRRMTRNPTKYKKNADRNRVRAIEQERRKIQSNAIKMVQRLAAVHDPSGALFNVKPVTTLEDGRVVSLEAVERRKQKEAQKTSGNAHTNPEVQDEVTNSNGISNGPMMDRLNPDRMKQLIESKMMEYKPGSVSKTQQKKLEMFAPRSPPTKPTIPEGIDIPSDEEENWLELWSLPDEDLDRRINREKRKKVRERKELRLKQKSGKAERRAARDEKRRVYREIKQSWKVLRQEETNRRKQLAAIEDEENKRLATEVTIANRARAMEVCAQLGFTLDNVEGVNEIKPKALGMKGAVVDFEKLEVTGETASGLKVKDDKVREKRKGGRVDLGAIADEKFTQPVYEDFTSERDASMNANFVELGSGGHHHEELSYNHRVRRKLRRAIENADIKKEVLVREAAIKHCEGNNMEVPDILRSATKAKNVKGARTMPDGTLETAKQERVRSRVELIEFNKMAKILRRQAKYMAIEAGIRIYLELTGRIPKREGFEEMLESRAAEKSLENGASGQSHGDEVESSMPLGGIWPAQSNASVAMADFLASWPMPEDKYAMTSSGVDADGDVEMEGAADNESEDSAAKQLKFELVDSSTPGINNGPMANGAVHESESTSDSESEAEEEADSDSDSDSDMS